ncbi:MAG: pseudouridine synthase [Verrucomicrobiota bacterium]
MMISIYKPFQMLSQFSPDGSQNATLKDLDLPTSVHPIGRLDADSEGLLLLTNKHGWEDKLLHPKRNHGKTYWAQVDGAVTPESVERLCRGVVIQGKPTKKCEACVIEPPDSLPERQPPVRFRKSVPTTWLEVTLYEGRNRQLRRMTAAIGHPSLRIVRTAIGKYRLPHWAPGSWRELQEQEKRQLTR